MENTGRKTSYIRNLYEEQAGERPLFPQLREIRRADVCVVGGGFTGLATAYYLLKQGFSVIVLEKQCLGYGASGRNGGQLIPGFATYDIGRECWDLSLEGVTDVEQIIQDEAIDCHYIKGTAAVAYTEKQADSLRRSVKKLADKFGYEKELIEPAYVPDFLGTDY